MIASTTELAGWNPSVPASFDTTTTPQLTEDNFATAYQALVGQYEQKAVTRVYFATGSTAINAQGRQDLNSIAAQAAAMQGASFRIVGHTDSTGNPAANQRLSSQRASAVTAYLVKNCQVPPEKFTAVAGVGQDLPQDSEDMGGAMNRRVAVFVLVSKASEGTSHLPPAGAPDPMAPTPQH